MGQAPPCGCVESVGGGGLAEGFEGFGGDSEDFFEGSGEAEGVGVAEFVGDLFDEGVGMAVENGRWGRVEKIFSFFEECIQHFGCEKRLLV